MRAALFPLVAVLLLSVFAWVVRACDAEHERINQNLLERVRARCVACKRAYPVEPAQYEHCNETCSFGGAL